MVVYAPAQIISAPAQLMTAPAQLITAPAQPPATEAVVYTALFSDVRRERRAITDRWLSESLSLRLHFQDFFMSLSISPTFIDFR